MAELVERAGLTVHPELADFIESEALPGTGVDASRFWTGFAELVADAMPRNRDLLAKRDDLQTRIDSWHRENGAIADNSSAYIQFLKEIGYLVDEPADFSVETANLDPEISSICGPQLVVPVSNARYALNAANARWGSLYDAFYGTDVIAREGDLAPSGAYNPARGAEVFRRTAEMLDAAFPLEGASHADVTSYGVAENGASIAISTAGGGTQLKDPTQYAGHRQDGETLGILLRNNGLHMELRINSADAIGKTHPAQLADVIVESALTTIQDCEDSVAAVDAHDKAHVYRNWLGLMNGSLSDRFEKGGRTVERALNADVEFTGADGKPLSLKGRSVLLVRNVGLLMKTDAIIDAEGQPISENLMDAAITVLCAMHDRKAGLNSKTGAVYVVMPKMHGPEEVHYACANFSKVEDILGLDRHTIKIGIMDEERRTSANLKACIHEARHRVFFINTGFLDRTGDEIHTSMEAGPVLRKDEIKSERWLQSYEDRNVVIGLACGLSGKAQIGKGMWAAPDAMADMVRIKIGHPQAGANTAWVPSPTAATLHALHYHQVDVFEAQQRRHNEACPDLEALFAMPVLDKSTLDASAIQRELDNNAQGILGYVVRWVDHGVGCSKVPDINNVGLMEDRATLRISAQHIANWMKHGVVSSDQVRETFERMAKVVDEQNAGDPTYRPMFGNFETSTAWQAALALAVEGASEPSGYTEPILHAKRAEVKADA